MVNFFRVLHDPVKRAELRELLRWTRCEEYDIWYAKWERHDIEVVSLWLNPAAAAAARRGRGE